MTGFWLLISGITNTTNEEDLVILDNQEVRQGRQICFDIGVVDDELVEPSETAVICGCSPHNVTFNGCVTLTIQDNDGKVLYFAKESIN